MQRRQRLVVLLWFYATVSRSHPSPHQDAQSHYNNLFENLWKNLQKNFQHHQRKQQKLTEQPSKPKQQHLQSIHLRKHLFEHAISSFDNKEQYLQNITYPVDRTSDLFAGLPNFPEGRKMHNLELIKDMFYHGYNSYMKFAYPSGEIRPLSCTSHDFDLIRLPALTLVDSLDTLLLLNNNTEFARSCERIRKLFGDDKFDFDANVSLFETNIRILGGLLSAHQLATLLFDEHQTKHRVPMEVVFDEDLNILETYHSDTCDIETNSTTVFWEYDGLLLELAHDLGERLLPAFQSPTGIPYGTINLRYGVPKDETTVASLAGAGTLSLEFELLSRLTGQPKFGRAAKLAARALFVRRSKLGLFGKHIDNANGRWTETLSGIGSNSDSFLEYLAKHYFVFHDEDFWTMLETSYAGVYSESRLGEWYVDVDMNYGISSGNARTVLESLAAFYPGLQVLLGEYTPASRSLNSFLLVREILGFLPERFHYGAWNIDRGIGAAKHPLRPELLESVYWMHRSTKNDGWAWAADFALHQLNSVSRASCGFASLNEVHPQQTGKIGGGDEIHFMDEMPSFFLSETLKYLYLTFDEDNILHRDDRQWIFTTEAHPIHKPRTKTFNKQVKALKEILEGRLGSKQYRMRRDVPDAATTLKDGTWTDKTDFHSFREDISQLEKQRPMMNVSNHELMPICPHGRYRLNHFRERNLAHLSVNDQGSGAHLKKHCPNVHRSELLWVRALTGGSLDYSDIYVSATSDSLSEQGIRYHLLGAAEAIGVQSSSMYFGERENDQYCGIVKEDQSKEAVVKKSTENPQIDNISSDGVMVMPSEMGNFEVSAFQDGTGFFVRHVESGEEIKTNFLLDESDTQEHVALVYSNLRTRSCTSEPKESAHNQLYLRSVTVSDFSENMFSCEVTLFRTDDPENNVDGDREEVMSVPCSPALFGPSQMSKLRELDSIESEAVLVAPPATSVFGCDHSYGPGLQHNFVHDIILPTQGKPNNRCGSWLTHIVHRGECSFFTKAINMNLFWDAEAMIVVNSSNDLFMMSSSADEIMTSFPDKMPLSVLVTKDDGSAIRKVLDNLSWAGQAVVAHISLFRRISISETPQVDVRTGATSPQWPIIQASSDRLDVLAEYGWGISATQHVMGDSYEWQLQLLRHGQ